MTPASCRLPSCRSDAGSGWLRRPSGPRGCARAAGILPAPALRRCTNGRPASMPADLCHLTRCGCGRLGRKMPVLFARGLRGRAPVMSGPAARRRRVLRLAQGRPDLQDDAGILPAPALRRCTNGRPASMPANLCHLTRCGCGHLGRKMPVLFARHTPPRAQASALKRAGMDAGAAIAPLCGTEARRMRAGVAQHRRPGGPPRTSQINVQTSSWQPAGCRRRLARPDHRA
jgi:hypothetical protein